MEQEITLNNQTPTEKVYKEKEVWVGTLLGGPLVAGYLIAQNFNAFGESDKARRTWIISIVATIIIFGIAFYAPFIERIPGFFFTLIYASIAYAIFQLYQEEKIKAYLKAGGQIHSWWRTVCVAVTGLTITLVPIIGTAMIIELSAKTNIIAKTYGVLKHEIAFDKSNISESEIDKLGNGFKQTTFFDDEKQKTIDAKKAGNDYEITVYCNNTIKSSPAAVGYFRDLRNDMQKLFPDNKIIFNLVIDTPDNIVKRLD